MSQALPMRSGNPVLTDATFRGTRAGYGEEAMTLQGTVNKTALALAVLMVAATYTWNMGPADARVGVLTTVGVLGGFVMALATSFRPTWAPITTPIYAALEGLALGGLSVLAETRFPGIVSQAVFLTFGTLGAMLLAYRSGLLRATPALQRIIMTATMANVLVSAV